MQFKEIKNAEKSSLRAKKVAKLQMAQISIDDSIFNNHTSSDNIERKFNQFVKEDNLRERINFSRQCTLQNKANRSIQMEIQKMKFQDKQNYEFENILNELKSGIAQQSGRSFGRRMTFTPGNRAASNYRKLTFSSSVAALYRNGKLNDSQPNNTSQSQQSFIVADQENDNQKNQKSQLLKNRKALLIKQKNKLKAMAYTSSKNKNQGQLLSERNIQTARDRPQQQQYFHSSNRSTRQNNSQNSQYFLNDNTQNVTNSTVRTSRSEYQPLHKQSAQNSNINISIDGKQNNNTKLDGQLQPYELQQSDDPSSQRRQSSRNKSILRNIVFQSKTTRRLNAKKFTGNENANDLKLKRKPYFNLASNEERKLMIPILTQESDGTSNNAKSSTAQNKINLRNNFQQTARSSVTPTLSPLKTQRKSMIPFDPEIENDRFFRIIHQLTSFTGDPDDVQDKLQFAQMVSTYKINLKTMMSMTSPEQKEKYIIDCFQLEQDKKMKDLRNKIALREDQQELQLKQAKNRETIRDIEIHGDFYQWLKLKCKYKALTKQVKCNVVDMVQDFEKFEFENEEQKQNKVAPFSDLAKSITQKRISQQKNIFSKETSEKNINVTMEQKNKFHEFFEKEGSKKLKSNTINIINDMTDLYKKMRSNFQRHAQQIQQEKEENETNDKQIIAFDDKIDSESQLKWDEEKEAKYNKTKSECKNMLLHQINSSNWVDMGMAPFIHQKMLEAKGLKDHNTLLQKYRDGQATEEADIKYLISTNTLLQSCADKAKIQQYINLLDEDIINAVELEVAEEILARYQKIRKLAKNTRFEYMQNKRDKFVELQKLLSDVNRFKSEQYQERVVKAIRIKIKLFQNKARQRIMQTEVSDLVKYANPFVKKMARLARRAKLRVRKQKIKNFGVDFAKTLARIQPGAVKKIQVKVAQTQNKTELKKDDQNEEELQSGTPIKQSDYNQDQEKPPPPQVQTQYQFRTNSIYSRYVDQMKKKTKQKLPFGCNVPIDIETSQHCFHPSSKVIFLQQRNQDMSHPYFEESISEVARQKRLAECEKFKLNHFSEKKLKNATRFREFYSGGPTRPSNTLLLNQHDVYDYPKTARLKNTWVTPYIEQQAALKIQTIMRMLIVKRRYQSAVKQAQEIKEKALIVKIQKLQEGKNFFNIMMQAIKRKEQKNNIAVSEKGRSTTQTEGKQIFQNKLNYVNEARSLFKKKQISNSKFFHQTTQQQNKNTQPQTSIKQKRAISLNNLANNMMQETHVGAEQPIQLSVKHRQLFKCIKMNQLQMCIKYGLHLKEADCNVKDNFGNTPLYYCAKMNLHDFSEYLLYLGANPNTPCKDGNSPMHMAMLTNNFQLVQLYINFKGSLNNINNDKQTPVAFASQKLLKLMNLKDATATVLEIDDHYKSFDNDKFYNSSHIILPNEGKDTFHNKADEEHIPYTENRNDKPQVNVPEYQNQLNILKQIEDRKNLKTDDEDDEMNL